MCPLMNWEEQALYLFMARPLVLLTKLQCMHGQQFSSDTIFDHNWVFWPNQISHAKWLFSIKSVFHQYIKKQANQNTTKTCYFHLEIP